MPPEYPRVPHSRSPRASPSVDDPTSKSLAKASEAYPPAPRPAAQTASSTSSSPHYPASPDHPGTSASGRQESSPQRNQETREHQPPPRPACFQSAAAKDRSTASA